MNKVDPPEDNLDSLSREELRNMARAAGIPRSSSMNKAELSQHLTLDRRWRALKREVLVEEAGRYGLTDRQDSDKSELIKDLHRAHRAAPQELEGQPQDAPGEDGDVDGAKSLPAGLHPSLGLILRASGYLGISMLLALAIAFPTSALLLSPRVESQLTDLSVSVKEVSDLLFASSLALEAASDTLNTTMGGLESTQATLADSQPMLDAVSELLGDQAPNTIESTRTALQGAQTGARAMDRVLRGLALFGLDYDPELPLDESLAMTADSLEPLPGALVGVQEDLDLVADDLQALEQNLGRVREDISTLSGAVRPMGEDLGLQARHLRELAGQLEDLGETARPRLTRLGYLGSFIAIWAAVTQVPLVILGGWLQNGVPGDRPR